ncbi:hypothetical protein BC830DRAFT_363873 [Chytriomyces sp. MP71]|nr:hypothetical protein BC830DRAFT_363873 [Chytriomyces sp. MP71]
MTVSSDPTHLFELDNASTETAPPDYIPIIDFSAFTIPNASASDRAKVANDLVAAFTNSGFVYLKDHGIPSDAVERMFVQSKEFFALDEARKEAVAWENAESNRGYVAIGREKLSDLDKEGRAEDIKKLNEISPDIKEAFDVREDFTDSKYRNRYPSTHFGDQCDSFFQILKKLNLSVMSAVGLGLGLGEDFFKFSTHGGGNNTLRILHYPRVPALEINDHSRRCGAHSDYGTVTFLFQDAVGGLEVLDHKSNHFVQVTPIPGTIVVNIGDLLQRWTNDHLKSKMHRVVKPYRVDEDGYLPARYSIAYFCDPDEETVVETIEQFITEKTPKKYAAVNAGEYLIARLNNTYV